MKPLIWSAIIFALTLCGIYLGTLLRRTSLAPALWQILPGKTSMSDSAANKDPHARNSVTRFLSAAFPVVCLFGFSLPSTHAQAGADEPFGLSTVSVAEAAMAATWKDCWSRSTTIYPSSPSVANSFSRVLHLPQLHLRRSQKKAIDMKAWLGLDTLIEQQTLQSGRSIQLTQMTNGGHLWRSSQGAPAIANIMHCSSMQCLERSAFHLMP